MDERRRRVARGVEFLDSSGVRERFGSKVTDARLRHWAEEAPERCPGCGEVRARLLRFKADGCWWYPAEAVRVALFHADHTKVGQPVRDLTLVTV